MSSTTTPSRWTRIVEAVREFLEIPKRGETWRSVTIEQQLSAAKYFGY